MRIMMLDKNTENAIALKQYLKKNGFYADVFNDCRLGLIASQVTSYNVIIISAGIWLKNNLFILKWWRSNGRKEPILYLASKDHPSERIYALIAGADDCIGMPCDKNEIIIRIRRLILLSKNTCGSHYLTHNNVILDPLLMKVFQGNSEIRLTSREVSILQILMLNKNRVISRKSLEEQLYDWDEYIISNSIEVHICNLRRKLGRDYIITVRGFGYHLARNDNTDLTTEIVDTQLSE
ncbi:winged helix-turn-helix domain-containing protein [Escherichia coli]|uniref:winged helix-turn-helix domain-containing protein n=1 Tax=Escherichia coli TaxID=562 RepID=UPI001E37DCC8|nr:winged helix-turn-helix domain-containing protein [Escherichia coli]